MRDNEYYSHSYENPDHIQIIDELRENHHLTSPEQTFFIFDTNEFYQQIGKQSSMEQDLIEKTFKWDIVSAGYVIHRPFVKEPSQDVSFSDYPAIQYVRSAELLSIDQLEEILTAVTKLHAKGTDIDFPFYQHGSHTTLDWYDPWTITWALHVGNWKTDSHQSVWLPPNDPTTAGPILEYLLNHLRRDGWLIDQNPDTLRYEKRMTDSQQILIIPTEDDHSLAAELKEQWARRGVRINSIKEIIERAENAGFILSEKKLEQPPSDRFTLSKDPSEESSRISYQPNFEPRLHTFTRPMKKI